MVDALPSSLMASSYPKRLHLTKTGADTLYAPIAAVGLSYIKVKRGVGAPTDGVTGMGELDQGDVYIDTATGFAYENAGTIGATVFRGYITT